MAACKGDKEIGDRINKIIGRLAEANDLKGVIDQADFNDENRLGAGKEMQDRLSKLVAIFEGSTSAPTAPGRRPAGRRLRVPDAALRHRVGQEQGAVLHPGRGLAGHGPGGRRGPGHPPRPDPLRPGLRLGLAAAQGRGRGAARHQRLRPGDGQRHLGAGPHEHDPARPRDRRAPARQHLAAPEFKRQNGCGLATFDFAVANPPSPPRRGRTASSPRTTSSGASSTASRQPGTATTPSLLHLVTSLKEHGPGRDHPPPRRAVPRQPGGRHPPRTGAARLRRGGHRPARQPCSTAPASRLHRGHRQGARARPQGGLPGSTRAEAS